MWDYQRVEERESGLDIEGLEISADVVQCAEAFSANLLDMITPVELFVENNTEKTN